MIVALLVITVLAAGFALCFVLAEPWMHTRYDEWFKDAREHWEKPWL